MVLKILRLDRLEKEEFLKIINRWKINLEAYREIVLKVLNGVRRNGDKALIKYTKIYDGVKLSREKLKVSEEEFLRAYRETPKNLIKVFRDTAKRIRSVHFKQLPRDKVIKKSNNLLIKQIFKPIDSVGIYIPAGRKVYPSTALMLTIPAKVAGVKKVVACTPPRKNGKIDPAILVALDMGGADEVYRVGGIQAIGALAYGTETIPKVNKIVGPGNVYVTVAKMMVYGEVGIDFPAGPTEIMIFADETANPLYTAMDLASQAEHDPNSTSILISTSEDFANKVKREIVNTLPKIVKKSVLETLKRNGQILVARDVDEAVRFINLFAPEHLEIIAKNPEKIVSMVKNAGLISVGSFTPVSVVDYAIGVNHVLPTGGAASFHSGLTVYDFLKPITILQLSQKGLKRFKQVVSLFSEIEGLELHAKSVEVRFTGKW